MVSANPVAQKEVTRWQAFQFIGDYVVTDMPKSYKYIDLKFLDVKKGTKLYDSLQKLVFLDVIENREVSFWGGKKVSNVAFFSLLKTITGFDFILDDREIEPEVLKYEDLKIVVEIIDLIEAGAIQVWNEQNHFSTQYTQEEENALQIYYDVYDTLKYDLYGKEHLNSKDLIYGSIQWLTKATWDAYTTFFPPIEAREFHEDLAGEFEWIWAYVDMPTPWVFQVVSPISGFPAEKAGLKWGDIVIQIGDKKVTPDMSLQEAINLIKWPAGTTIQLTIFRDGEELIFDVIREKITLNDVEYEVLENGIFYIQIRMFWDKVNAQFLEALENLKHQNNVKKVIIDLRNNPGWYLEQVNEMLSTVIQKSEPIAVIKSLDGVFSYESKWYDIVDLSDYDVYLLWNEGTASASEIMIGTLKDYFPNITFVGQKTFWKWSVQTLRNYYDGSALKYTIANWYTGKSQTAIDGIWILPDVEVELDAEKIKAWVDSQLEWVKKR